MTYDTDNRHGRPPKLTPDDLLIITRQDKAGRSSRVIARMLSTTERSISHRTVARWLRRARAPQETIQLALAAHRMQAVDDWAAASKQGRKYGRHAPAKDLLIATGTIHPDSPGDRVVILVGDGATVVAPLPPSAPPALAPASPQLSQTLQTLPVRLRDHAPAHHRDAGEIDARDAKHT